MLIALILSVVAVFMCCGLLLRLSVHALQLFAAFFAATYMYQAAQSAVAALAAAALAGIATIALARIVLGLTRTNLARAAVGTIFALPAAFAGYHAVRGIAEATMPVSSWSTFVSLIGAAAVAATSWMQWSRAVR